MTDPDYQTLLSKYHEERHTLSMKQLGQREAELWAAFKASLTQTERTASHYHAHNLKFSEDIGVVINIVKKRLALTAVGTAADPLWEKLQAKRMTLTSAETILLESKKYSAKHDERLGDVIPRAIEAYYQLPDKVHHQGIPVHKGQLVIPPPGGVEEEEEAPAPRRPTAVPAPARNHAKDETDEGVFWAKITSDVMDHVSGQFDSAHEVPVEMAMQDFLIELRVVVTDAKDKIRKFVRSQERSRKANLMPVDRVVEACKAIGIEPPRLGEPIDLEFARKNRRKTLGRHHADRPENQGEHAERHAELYQRALNALETLELYNAQLNPTGEGTRSHA